MGQYHDNNNSHLIQRKSEQGLLKLMLYSSADNMAPWNQPPTPEMGLMGTYPHSVGTNQTLVRVTKMSSHHYHTDHLDSVTAVAHSRSILSSILSDTAMLRTTLLP